MSNGATVVCIPRALACEHSAFASGASWLRPRLRNEEAEDGAGTINMSLGTAAWGNCSPDCLQNASRSSNSRFNAVTNAPSHSSSPWLLPIENRLACHATVECTGKSQMQRTGMQSERYAMVEFRLASTAKHFIGSITSRTPAWKQQIPQFPEQSCGRRTPFPNERCTHTALLASADYREFLLYQSMMRLQSCRVSSGR